MFGCLDVWMFGCLDVWMFGCLDVWMFGCLDVWGKDQCFFTPQNNITQLINNDELIFYNVYVLFYVSFVELTHIN